VVGLVTVPLPDRSKYIKPIGYGVAGAALYEALKWGAATLAAPETGGASFIVAGAMP
jgi:hypothetical protein